MLVLSRHRDEQIVIGDDIVITVVEIRGDKVRLGIDASRNVPVHRREVYDAIHREKSAEVDSGTESPGEVATRAPGSESAASR